MSPLNQLSSLKTWIVSDLKEQKTHGDILLVDFPENQPHRQAATVNSPHSPRPGNRSGSRVATPARWWDHDLPQCTSHRVRHVS